MMDSAWSLMAYLRVFDIPVGGLQMTTAEGVGAIP